MVGAFKIEKAEGSRKFYKPNTPIAQPFIEGKMYVLSFLLPFCMIDHACAHSQMPLLITPVKAAL